jgi:putative ABC transport system permease protein
MITPQDRAETLPVAVISEELARQGFGNDDPIGKRIRRGRPQDTSNPWLVVVGVVKDAKEDRLNFRIARPVWYIPYAQNTPLSASSGLNLVARTHSDPAAVAGAVRAAIREVNQFQPVVNVSTEDAMVSSVVAGDRFSARVMAILAGVGLFLAALGLYTVIAYSVTQRTGEIGLRMALGARPGSVLALVARQGCALAILGLAIGTPLMLLAARLLAGVLFAVRPNDPSVLFAITAVLSAITIAACALPAWRATRLDPLKALRHD